MLKDRLVKHVCISMTSLDVCKMKIYCLRKKRFQSQSIS